MKKKIISSIAFITIIFALVFSALPVGIASASIADGTYQVNYQVLKSDSNSASIADGYFTKKGTLIVENGTQYVQVTVSSSDMLKSISGPYGKASVVSESGNSKVLKLKIADINKPVNVKMHVVVDAGEIQYDTEHGARFVFDSVGSSSGGSAKATSSGGNNDGQTANNPKTGDGTPILLFSVLLIGSGLILARRFAIK